MTNDTRLLADIYPCGNSLHIEVPAGYGDYIELRTGDDLLELLRDLIAAGNKHFGTTARLIEASEEVRAALFLSDDVRIAPSDYPPINFDDHDHRTIADELSPLHWFGREDDGARIQQDYTWAEHQAANQQALDEIAAAMGRKRE